MKFRVLGCYGGNVQEHGMTSFLLNDSVCLDAGWVSGALNGGGVALRDARLIP